MTVIRKALGISDEVRAAHSYLYDLFPTQSSGPFTRFDDEIPRVIPVEVLTENGVSNAAYRPSGRGLRTHGFGRRKALPL